MSSELGIVAIGRNEGRRLETCLGSVAASDALAVYVDSGSTDGSVELARGKGAQVVELSASEPFTMARGRNAGFARLEQLNPAVEWVQFVDGDCELVEGWLEAARRVLENREDVAVVCGRRRERYRESSLYNRLADMEWDGLPGEVRFAGGDVMVRAQAFRAVGGYREEMIAGEDPEICVRLRHENWKILRIDEEMTRHDAAISRFGQWWRRAIRGGHAYAEGAYLHRRTDERPWSKECRSIWSWGLVLPVAAVIGACWISAWALLALGLYPIWALRIALRRHRDFGDAWRDCWAYGSFCMLGKFPQLIGQIRFWWNRITGRRATLIEYKKPETSGSGVGSPPSRPGVSRDR